MTTSNGRMYTENAVARDCTSTRPGTPAAEMPDQIPAEIKAERNARLLERREAYALDLDPDRFRFRAP